MKAKLKDFVERVTIERIKQANDNHMPEWVQLRTSEPVADLLCALGYEGVVDEWKKHWKEPS